jgi:uncharacterized protein YjbI with pentapeptide repeats
MEMTKMTIDIKQTLADHTLWIADNSVGTRANLSGANLSGANLFYAKLYGANLSGAYLSGANLSRANLSGADLSGANLSGANLSGANLFYAKLYGANLSGADLSGASLFGADLSGAYLSGANLSGADLRIAVMDTPVYQFYLGKYNAVATKDYLRVGCEVHSWDEWLTNYNQYGVSAGFSDKEIQDHSRVIKLFHELLCGEIT